LKQPFSTVERRLGCSTRLIAFKKPALCFRSCICSFFENEQEKLRVTEEHHLPTIKIYRMQENEKREGQKSRRGFAAMSAERQREIASQGGRAAHEQGVAHEWSKDEARAAGKKGGQASGFRRRSTEQSERDLIL
jgi:general stress protein YciG